MFRTVIIGVDGRPGGQDAIALARQLADPGARLILANVYTGGDTPSVRGVVAPFATFLRQDSEKLLQAALTAADIEADLAAVSAPTVGKGLQRLLESRSGDLLVVGSSHQRTLTSPLGVDHARSALNRAPCAIAIAPTGYSQLFEDFREIGVGYDGSRESAEALSAARELARRSQARVRTMSAISLASLPAGVPAPDNWPKVAGDLVDSAAHSWDKVDGVDGDAACGDPGEVLTQFSGEIDLLIVGTRAQHPVARLLHGSTANTLARHAHCPLLVFPRGSSAGPLADAAHRHTETSPHR